MLTKLVRYIGSFESVEDLPASAYLGDLVSIRDEAYIFNGETWEDLGLLTHCDVISVSGKLKYANCPSCGAVAKRLNCQYCGRDLTI